MMNQRNLKLKPGDGTVIYRSAAHCLVTVSYFNLFNIVIRINLQFVVKAKFLLLLCRRVHPNSFILIIIFADSLSCKAVNTKENF